MKTPPAAACVSMLAQRRVTPMAKEQHAVTEVIDRQICDHSLQIPLRPCRNGANTSSRSPAQEATAEDLDLMWEKRKQQADETVTPIFERRPVSTIESRWRGLIASGSRCETETAALLLQGRRRIPANASHASLPVSRHFAEPRKAAKSKVPSRNKFRETRATRDAAEEGVKEKLGRAPVPVFAAHILMSRNAGIGSFREQEPETNFAR